MDMSDAAATIGDDKLAFEAGGWQMSDGQVQSFIDYFGAHPKLLEGARYFGNSERAAFIKAVTNSSKDVSQ